MSRSFENVRGSIKRFLSTFENILAISRSLHAFLALFYILNDLCFSHAKSCVLLRSDLGASGKI